MDSNRKVRCIAPLVSLYLLLSAAFLLICTKSSPFYPLNDWVDANIYFTIGKGMMHGYVPYLDLYDQKGPVAFLLYGLASLVSGTSFFGVYLLETLAFAGMLYASFKTLSLFTNRAIWALPVIAACVLGSMSFSHGGSFEELMMPLFAWSLFDSIRYFKAEYPKPIALSTIARNAILAGAMFFGKFTLLAFYIAWMGVIAVSQLVIHKWKRAVGASLLFLGIMLAMGLPWVVYFGANDTLGTFFHYYFYQNMFGYSYLESPVLPNMILAIVKGVGAFFYRNPQISLFLVLGFVWLLFQKRSVVKPVEKINAVLLFGLLAAGVYMGGQGYRYYGLALAPFMVLGFLPILRWIDSKRVPASVTKQKPFLYAALSILMLALAFGTTDNRYLLFYPREETPQAVFAQTMREEKTEPEISLFCYAFPDGGFYLAADVIPSYRYFATSNVGLPEIGQAQAQYVEEKSAEFIVTRNRDETPEGYQLLDTRVFWSEGYDDEYRLFQRVN
ncbi:MAG: hypothetical protein VB034_13440 [Eubacteriales bacterium]|nr:hypothetical protein [Eubacteriales bacterium]